MKNVFFFLLSLLILLSCSQEEQIGREAREQYKGIARSTETFPEDPFALSVSYFSGDNKVDPAPIPEPPGPVEIVDRGPVGPLPGENGRPVIYAVLSHPAVPLAALGEPLAEYAFMEIDPPVEGVYRWYGSRVIGFEPGEPLEPEQRYGVILKKGLSSLGGAQLKEDHLFSFETETLEITAFYPGTPWEPWQGDLDEVPSEQAGVMTVCFNHGVDKDVLASQLVVETSRGEHPFKAEYPEDRKDELPVGFKERTLVLTLDENPPNREGVTLILPEGAYSRKDSLGTAEEQRVVFSTLSEFRYLESDDYNWRFPREGDQDVRPVYLEFSHPLEAETVLENLAVSLDLAEGELADHVAVWDKYVRINNLPVEYDSTYTLTLRPGIKDIYGRELADESELEIEVGPASSYYYIPHQGYRFLEAQYPARVALEYQNLAGGLWHAQAVSDPYSTLPENRLTTPFDLSGQVRNEPQFAMVDLAPYLNDEGKGAVALSWLLKRENTRWGPYRNDLTLQVTDLGITLRYAHNRVLVWVNGLSDGEPVAGARVELLNGMTPRLSGRTDETGLARFDLTPGQFVSLFYDSRERFQLRARASLDSDTAVFRPNGSHSPYQFGLWSQTRVSRVEEARPFTFLFSDRGLYKPGETLTFKGIDRDLVLGEWVPYTGEYTLGIRENTWRSETVREVGGVCSDRGSFHGTLEIAEDLPPGNYLMEYRRTGGDVIRMIAFMVENFRRAGFQVTLEDSGRELLPGGELSFPVTASYLAGGSLAGADYTARWTREPMSFSPGDGEYEAYVFGPRDWENSSFLGSSEGVLDGEGRTVLSHPLEDPDDSGRTYLYRVEASVQDPTRQEIAGRGFAVVHPAEFYIGTRVKKASESGWTRFVAAGESSRAEILLLTPEGKPRDGEAGELTLRLLRREWKVARQRGIGGRISNNWEEEIIPVREETLTLKAGEATAEWDFVPDKAGYYTLEIIGRDGEGRIAKTEMTLYASGAQWVKWQNRDPGKIELVTDRDLYAPGDTARIMVQSPLEKGRYLLTIEREGILEERMIDLEGSASVIEIPIKEEWVPVMYVSLSSFSPRREEPPSSFGEPDLGKPRGCYGLAALAVSPETRLLDVSIEMDRSLYGPGESARCEITVTRNGDPVEDCEVTLLGVDRGVLDLIGYHVPDPLDYFYNRNNYIYGVHGGDSRADLIDPVTYELKDLQGGGGDDKLNRRDDFTPLAVFKPSLLTGEDGVARTEFAFPDTLTTYRFTALAVERERFGRQEEEVLVQNPLTVVTAVPPRLRVRDTAFCGLFITNLTDQEVPVEVTARIDPHYVTLNGVTARDGLIKPGETREIRFPLQALNDGETKVLFTVTSPVLSEQVEQVFAVEKPVVPESFTVTGEIVAGGEAAGEGLIIPSGMADNYGDLTLDLSANRFANLTGSLAYFANYPYDLTLDNRLMHHIPALVLGDVLETLAPELYDPESLSEFYSKAAAHQQIDGGFAFTLSPWSDSSYWLSVRMLHILSYPLKGYGIRRGGELGPIDVGALEEYVYAGCFEEKVSPELKLYALYALSLTQGPEKGNRSVIYLAESERDRLGLSGYLLAALSLDRKDAKGEETYRWLSQRMANLVKVGTRSLDITDTYEGRRYFDSQIQDLALLFLLYEREGNVQLARLAASTLVDRQNYGRWERLNDTLFAFTALAEEIGKTAGTDLTVTVTLGDQKVGETDFQGAGDAPYSERLDLFGPPLESLPRDTLIPLAVEAEGTGRAYYAASLNYALPWETARARDEGFSLYTVIEDPHGGEVRPDKLKLGETYRMRAVVSSSKRRSMAVVEIPVPSGAEILNAAFDTTSGYAGNGGVDGESWIRESDYGRETSYREEGYAYYTGDGFYLAPFEQEKRIGVNKVTYGFSDFYPGRREVTFLFRTYCPGVYPVPPAEAVCLYEEEVFGRTDGALYVIE